MDNSFRDDVYAYEQQLWSEIKETKFFSLKRFKKILTLNALIDSYTK